MLLLSRSEVADLLDVRQAIKCTEDVFLEQARGRTYPWPPFVVGHGDRELRVNAAALSGLKLAGLRAGMRGASLAVLFDTAAERPVCLMAYSFTYVRVGATVGLAVDRLARHDARRLLVVGTGRIARASLEAVSCLRTFERVQAYSRQAANRQDFCSTARSRWGLEVEPVEDLEAAVREADVVVIATSASRPVLRGAWLAEGTHVSTAGIRCEIDDEAYLQAGLVVVGSKQHERNYVGWIDETNDNTLVRLAREGRLDWAGIAELGEIVAGHRVPRGFTVFRESQGGFGDLILANWVYQRATELHRGQTWDILA